MPGLRLRCRYDNCEEDSEGNIFVIGTDSCDLLLSGADAAADRLQGGLDGVYYLSGCFDGKPMYHRSEGPQDEPRVLWWSYDYADFEISTSSDPSLDHKIMFSDKGHISLLSVPNWHLASTLNHREAALMDSDDDDLYYIAPGIKFQCVEGAPQHA